MKEYLLLFLFSFSLQSESLMAQIRIDPCPNSPNCVSTKAVKKRKRMAPISYSGEAQTAKKKLISTIAKIRGSSLLQEESLALHFIFVTKLGKFTDDVVFIIEEENKLIHFRSASRKGWYDLRANRRRMKKISKLFGEN